MHQEFKDDKFVLLAVDVGEKKETVENFINKNGYSFLNILDINGIVSAQYGVRSHPMKFLINKKGELIGIARGYRKWDTEDMKLLISSLITSQ